ncbi:MAG: NADH-quinone oxidoreductase subunit NuoH [Anaerolineales bacterium]|nr:NADH-quinone oxidoreductase subunit NuoH [Anaerolineales bacterium]
MDWTTWLEWAIKSLVLIFTLLIGFGYLTYYERRFLAFLQSRLGPNRAGPQGLMQWMADAVKLIFKEELTPAKAYKLVFFLAPIITMVPSIVITAVIPWGPPVQLFGRTITQSVADINVGVLFLMSIASIAVYGIVLAGWSSNNKYAMMGGLRSSAQMISYELTLGLSFVAAILLGNSMSLVEIVEAQRGPFGWFVFVQPVGAFILWIATIAEVNRHPFDMPEAEQEIVAGYHTEYSGMKFALFFMAEYQKMIVVSAILATLFFGGYLGPGVDQFPWLGPLYMFIKIFVLLGIMIWVRASWPRIRYHRLMDFGWKVLLPLALAVVFITAVGILLAQDVNPWLLWLTPILSLLAGWFATLMVDRTIRRKNYA